MNLTIIETGIIDNLSKKHSVIKRVLNYFEEKIDHLDNTIRILRNDIESMRHHIDGLKETVRKVVVPNGGWESITHFNVTRNEYSPSSELLVLIQIDHYGMRLPLPLDGRRKFTLHDRDVFVDEMVEEFNKFLVPELKRQLNNQIDIEDEVDPTYNIKPRKIGSGDFHFTNNSWSY